MPGELGEDPHLDAIFRIGAAIEVLREQLHAAGMGEEVLVERLELLLCLFAVALPPDRVLGRGVDNGVLVLRRAAGVMARLGAERAALHDRTLARCDRVLVEHGSIQIPVDRGQLFEAELIGAVNAVPHTRFLHGRPPSTHPAPPETPPGCRVLRHGYAYYSADPHCARAIVRIIRAAKSYGSLRFMSRLSSPAPFTQHVPHRPFV